MRRSRSTTLAADPDLATNAGRRADRGRVVTAFQKVLLGMTAAEALNALRAVDVPCSLINTLSEVVDDPQVRAREAIATQLHPVAGEFRGVTAPWRLVSQSHRPAPATPAPLRGEHGRSILNELGLDDDTVDALVDDGVVWTP